MPELQLADRQRSPGKGSCSDLAPVQILFTLCARTCHRWNKAVRSPQVLKMLSIVRFPLPAEPWNTILGILRMLMK